MKNRVAKRNIIVNHNPMYNCYKPYKKKLCLSQKSCVFTYQSQFSPLLASDSILTLFFNTPSISFDSIFCQLALHLLKQLYSDSSNTSGIKSYIPPYTTTYRPDYIRKNSIIIIPVFYNIHTAYFFSIS